MNKLSGPRQVILTDGERAIQRKCLFQNLLFRKNFTYIPTKGTPRMVELLLWTPKRHVRYADSTKNAMDWYSFILLYYHITKSSSLQPITLRMALSTTAYDWDNILRLAWKRQKKMKYLDMHIGDTSIINSTHIWQISCSNNNGQPYTVEHITLSWYSN